MIDRHPNSTTSDEITEDAAFWCMRLHAQDCTQDERAAFERWLQEAPAHADEYREMLEIWTVSAHLPISNKVSDGLGRRSISGRNRYVRSQRFVAAAAIVALGVLLGWSQGWVPHSFNRYSTQTEMRTVVLADDSQVHLNRNTSLSFLNFRDRRYALLREGEAFFQVRHDAAHPFEVKAGNGRIIVTGTQFNVWKYGDHVAVTLTEGSVKVLHDREQPGQTTVYLSPSQQMRYDNSAAQPQIDSINPGSVLAWREGKLILNDLPLREALPMINRYLKQPVMLADTATSDIRIGGVFNTDDVQGLLTNLPNVLPVRLAKTSSGTTVIERISESH